MRYRTKHLLYLMLLMWSMWYLGIISVGPALNRAETNNVIPKEGYGYESKTRIKPQTETIKAPVVIARFTTPDSQRTGPSNEWLHTYLPHVVNPQFVKPRVALSKGRANVSLVIGIPTVKRPSKDFYVLDTVKSFFNAMNDRERANCVIVISIAEPWDLNFETQLIEKIKSMFTKELEEGALEVIAPYPEFYPELDRVKLSLGDSKTRVMWRSKQNIDYGFLMMHCYGKATYYLQMEDDISTVNGFVSSILKTANEENNAWVSLCFSALGYIGRLYKDRDLGGVMEYLLKNFDKKPCDWLQFDYVRATMCGPSVPRKQCTDKYTKLIKPTLFQHKGFRSSLLGHVNRLQDKYFGKGSKHEMYANPKAKSLLTSLSGYGKYTLEAVYGGKSFFWGKSPRQGDCIEILYHPPISIQKLVIISAQKKHLTDIIANATVQILPAKRPTSNSSLLALAPAPLDIPDGNNISKSLQSGRAFALPQLYDKNVHKTLYTIGDFTHGVFEGQLPSDVGEIRLLRIRFNTDLQNWVIIDQLLVLS